jgi:cytochrome bd-type quinol oxidase subunit 2
MKDADIPKISAGDLITNGLNIVYFVAGMVAVVMIIMAGYNYLTANGDSAKAQKAMSTIIQCAIGIVVVVFAFAITNFVAGRM